MYACDLTYFWIVGASLSSFKSPASVVYFLAAFGTRICFASPAAHVPWSPSLGSLKLDIGCVVIAWSKRSWQVIVYLIRILIRSWLESHACNLFSIRHFRGVQSGNADCTSIECSILTHPTPTRYDKGHRSIGDLHHGESASCNSVDSSQDYSTIRGLIVLLTNSPLHLNESPLWFSLIRLQF
jgi:hypothetical protein